MGSLRFRRSIRLGPGVRLNVNKRSIGISAGVRGARASINSDGRSTRSIGIPGSGLSYRDQTGPRSRRVPTRRTTRHGIGWPIFLIFLFLALTGHSDAAGWVGAIGLLALVVSFIL